ncbi:hypothetical protein Salat_1129700 [Sesamum alatum]|uniref:Gag-asp_proteas domain-containing protein n=1 Tax=Sesamum alatum TaxID=300844 RepID=A0AAE2CN53_9LAMI|nr:hypothetical protein Salat_1129700 [Sesamum alatum]
MLAWCGTKSGNQTGWQYVSGGWSVFLGYGTHEQACRAHCVGIVRMVAGVGRRVVRQLCTGLTDIGSHARQLRWVVAEQFQANMLELWEPPPNNLPVALLPQVETLRLRVETLQKSVDTFPGFVEGRVTSVAGDVSILTDVVDIKFDGMKTEVNLLKRVMGREEDRAPAPKVKGQRKGWQGGKDRKFKKKKNNATGSGNKDTAQPIVDRTTKSCYFCNGDHRMRDCPKRGKLNALGAEADEDDEGEPSQFNPLQLLSAMEEKPPKHKGLMYVWVQVNCKEVMVMIDIGATHNFVVDCEIQKLGLSLT